MSRYKHLHKSHVANVEIIAGSFIRNFPTELLNIKDKEEKVFV